MVLPLCRGNGATSLSFCRCDAAAALPLRHCSGATSSLLLCILLKWGALDAEVYSETSRNIIKILWEIGTSRFANYEFLWVKARIVAFESLSHYEV
ncbi:hypothetical protein GW17_00014872 [Ensete ventricosum]|nr:hypothetical protein GW17_00014872 [Ensete ventricosum]